MSSRSLAGKTLGVTGAGSGIGRAIAVSARAAGATVIANDIEAGALQRLADAIDLDEPQRIAADVSDEGEVQAMFAALDARGLTPDAWINSAGIAESKERWERLNRIAEARLESPPSRGPSWHATESLSLEAWRRMFAVHVEGTFLCSREAVRRMTRRGNGGAIVNLSSTAALHGLADAPHYAAAKAAVLGLTRSLARDVAEHGIRVNAVAPGYTRTPMTEPISPKIRRASERSIPLGRWAEPEEIAAVVLFLASDDASYVTGQCWAVDGGA